MARAVGSVLPLFLAALAVSASCFAQEAAPAQNARWLVDQCSAANSLADGTAQQRFGEAKAATTALAAGYCYGYLAGFHSGFSAGKHSPQELHACVPDGVNPAQTARLLEVKLRQKPEFEHVEAMVFLMAVLHTTWPCPE
jgi:hypothetical protein